MPPRLPPLTLIVATTPSLGIGLRGTLPWPPLKSDLAFFARVTKRVPSSTSIYKAKSEHTSPSDHSIQNGQSEARRANNGDDGTLGKVKNAVIMGRKTWESIPPRFRPLKERINVVVTRTPDGFLHGVSPEKADDVLAVGSIEAGLEQLQERYPALDADQQSSGEQAAPAPGLQLGRVFVIGGSEIYRLALGMETCERVLWTRLESEWECDTVFPAGVLDESEGGIGRYGRWRQKEGTGMEAWTGEEGLAGLKRDGDQKYEVLMMEKEA